MIYKSGFLPSFLSTDAATCGACALQNQEVEESGEQLWRVFRETLLIKKMQLHFTKDVLPDSVSTDFQNLNKFNEQVNSRFLPPQLDSFLRTNEHQFS